VALVNEDGKPLRRGCAECDGLTVVALVDEDGKPLRRGCALCGTSTDIYCSGCKRHLCVGKDRSQKLKDKGSNEVPQGYYQMTHENRMNICWEHKRGEPSPLDRGIGRTHPNVTSDVLT
jgi:hypothetical protein